MESIIDILNMICAIFTHAKPEISSILVIQEIKHFGECLARLLWHGLPVSSSTYMIVFCVLLSFYLSSSFTVGTFCILLNILWKASF